MFLCCSSQLHQIYTKLLFKSLQQTLWTRRAAEHELVWEEDLHTCFTVPVTLNVNARTQPMSHTRAAQATQELTTLKHICSSSSVSIQEATVFTQLENHRMTQAGRASWGLLSTHLSQPVHQDLIQLSSKIPPGLKCLQPFTVSVPVSDHPYDRKGGFISMWNLPFQLVCFALAPSSCTSRKVWQHLFYTLSTQKVAKGSTETPE